MILESSRALAKYISFLNIFSYISVRVVAALLTSLMSAILLGDWYIRFAARYFRVATREHVPQGHQAKNNLPTMGGIFIVGTVLISVLLWCDIYNPHITLVLGALLFFGAIGLWDDWSKIVTRRGIKEKHKFLAQMIASGILVIAWISWCEPSQVILLPVVKSWQIVLPKFLFVAWAMFIIIGTSNAVNLTDGLDGLAIGSLLQNFAAFSMIAYCAGHVGFAAYLHMPYVGTGELAIVGGALVGAALGFLWFNAYPAQIFMGDVGSLSLGAVLGLIALMTRQEMLLGVSGVLFVAEALSVMLQVCYFRFYKKRLFRMAPIHHHFELLGWPEAKIVTRFGIITSVACLCALLMLKVR